MAATPCQHVAVTDTDTHMIEHDDARVVCLLTNQVVKSTFMPNLLRGCLDFMPVQSSPSQSCSFTNSLNE